MMPETFISIAILVTLFIISKTAVVISSREIGILERVGKFKGVLEPGLHFLIPFIDRVRHRHEIREQVIDIPMQTCITRDNIQVTVDGDVYFKVVDPVRASYGIADYRNGVMHLAMTTLRSEIGKLELDTAFAERDRINASVVREIDEASDPWGVKVLRYGVETVQPGHGLIQTLERQMEAERSKRAEITLAEAERASRTNIAEGERQHAINISEGDRQRRINEAEGRARAIAIEAEATAKALARVAQAFQRPGGSEAVRLQIVERFIEQFGNVLSTAKISVVPADLANIKGIFEGIDRVTAQGGLRPGQRQGGR
jgi:regulator of protease activity HflC (stomatin/prohibitin superfamily)